MGRQIGFLSLIAIAAAAFCCTGCSSKQKPIEFGVPIYPGAVTEVDSFATRLSPADRARLVKAVMYTTDDAPDKVISFYKERLKGKTEVFESSRRHIPEAVFRTEINGKPQMVMISWNEDTSKTEITIGNITPPQ
jgi:hypothetical protein